jgi:hypothetical protein
MSTFEVSYRSKETSRKRRKTVQAESEARKLIEIEATEIYGVNFVPEPLATDRQIQMLRALGVNPAARLTVIMASQQIGALLAEGREVDSAVFHANDPASERQLEYYRALRKKITPEIQRLSYNQMGILIEQTKAGGAVANYDIVDREKPATESQFYRLRQWRIDVTPEMEKMNKAEIKKIINLEEDRRRKIHEQERDARAEIHAKILKSLPKIDLSRLPYKTWAAAARAFKNKFAKIGADYRIDPQFGGSVSLFIETVDDAEEEYFLGVMSFSKNVTGYLTSWR